MPRMGRVVLPNYPHHIVQRGHNRQVIFAGQEDFEYYLEILGECKEIYQVKIYAYCLMTNHVHLLVQPGNDVQSLGQFMKRVAARMTRYRNHLEGRSGTLWESRYKSSPVQTDQYLLACCRYIELNPVRARMVTEPQAYRWSSYRSRMGEAAWGWLDVDPGYCGLGGTDAERRQRYARFVRDEAPPEEGELIREAVQRGQLTGNDRFVDEVNRIARRRIERRGRGRPRKSSDEQAK
jgi:putative transposase